MNADLSLVFSYRDREVDRVKRCLDSLSTQTDANFKVIFVDYGSNDQFRKEIESLVNSYDFCEYIYSHTYQQFWNRSKALNIGIQLVDTPYYATTDIDLIFEPNFIEVMRSEMGPDKFVHGHALFLEEGFSDYKNLDKLNKSNLDQSKAGVQYGLFQLVPTKVIRQLDGFDEFFRIWGLEDVDLNKRLLALGLKENWIDPLKTHAWHQWHPHIGDPLFTRDWYRFMEDYFFRQTSSKRNNGNWGQTKGEQERKVLNLKSDEATVQIERDFPSKTSALYEYHILEQVFDELSAGEVLSVKFNDKASDISFFEKLRNSLVHRIGVDLKVDIDKYYQKRTDFIDACRGLVWLIAKKENQGTIADYCFYREGRSFYVKLERR